MAWGDAPLSGPGGRETRRWWPAGRAKWRRWPVLITTRWSLVSSAAVRSDRTPSAHYPPGRAPLPSPAAAASGHLRRVPATGGSSESQQRASAANLDSEPRQQTSASCLDSVSASSLGSEPRQRLGKITAVASAASRQRLSSRHLNSESQRCLGTVPARWRVPGGQCRDGLSRRVSA